MSTVPLLGPSGGHNISWYATQTCMRCWLRMRILPRSADDTELFPVQVPGPDPGQVPVPPADYFVPRADLATTQSANLLRAVALQHIYWSPRGYVLIAWVLNLIIAAHL
jgi:hypothetical protein